MEEPAAGPPDEATAGRAGPPAKMPLDQFLAEFEERLRLFPDQPATGALLALDDRAAGARHSTVESEPDRPPRLPRPRPWRAPALPAPAADSPPDAPPASASEPPAPEAAGAVAGAPEASAAAEGTRRDPEKPQHHRHHRRRRRHR